MDIQRINFFVPFEIMDKIVFKNDKLKRFFVIIDIQSLHSAKERKYISHQLLCVPLNLKNEVTRDVMVMIDVKDAERVQTIEEWAKEDKNNYIHNNSNELFTRMEYSQYLQQTGGKYTNGI
jgi:hypothetical protein